MRSYTVLLGAAGLIVGQAVVAGTPAAAATPIGAGFQATVSARSHSSLSLNINGVNKARVKVKGKRFRKTLKRSSVVHLPTGKYRVRAFNVKRAGTSYVPDNRKFTVRAKVGSSFVVTVDYAPVGRVDTGTTAQPASQVQQSSVPSGQLGTMFKLVNEARSHTQRCGTKTMPPTSPVTYNDEIAKAAQAHADDMAAKDYFDHDSLDGRSFSQRIRSTDYSGYPAGENIASGFQTAADTLEGWLDSPGHCVNLMDPEFDEMGLGFASRLDAGSTVPVTYWVQDFGYKN
ncbi:MAG: CAP domain-containing protein [Candidatus Nanopelagicales bacterium]